MPSGLDQRIVARPPVVPGRPGGRPTARAAAGPDATPQVSVVVPCRDESERILGALACLHRQSAEGIAYEIVVVDSSRDGTARLVRERFPFVRLIHAETPLTAGAARNLGLRAARGEKILVTDAGVRVPPDWIARMSAHLDEVDLVGGAVANGTPGSLAGTALYLLEFFRLLPEASPAGPANAPFLATANAGYRRAALAGRSFADASAGEDIAFHHGLLSAGACGLFDPTLSVEHLNRTRWGSVARHLVRLGEGGWRWRELSRPKAGLDLRHPLMVAKPFAVVAHLAGRALVGRQWRRLARLAALSPLLLVLDGLWVVGYLRAWRAARRRSLVAGRAAPA